MGFPRFPVGVRGVDTVHAPFFTERRTRGPVQLSVAGNPGRPSFSAHVRWCEHGAPIEFCLVLQFQFSRRVQKVRPHPWLKDGAVGALYYSATLENDFQSQLRVEGFTRPDSRRAVGTSNCGRESQRVV
jgi:hypothetical protein